MSASMMIAHDRLPDPLLFVGDMADRLKRSLRGASADTDRWQLIEQVLAYAANAEQQLTAQRQRIAQLESLSMTDELTGLANRRGFRDFLRRTLSGAKRHGENGVLAYFDLDYFKDINDRHGHEAGDAALLHIADILTKGVRQSDFVARLHGDEFAVLLLRTTASRGAGRLRLLQQRINDTPLCYGGKTLSIQTSMGICDFGPDSDPSELLRRADRAMYQEKRGRSASHPLAAE